MEKDPGKVEYDESQVKGVCPGWYVGAIKIAKEDGVDDACQREVDRCWLRDGLHCDLGDGVEIW